MEASEEILDLIWEAENSETYREGSYNSLLAIVKMEFYLNREKLDTIESVK